MSSQVVRLALCEHQMISALKWNLKAKSVSLENDTVIKEVMDLLLLILCFYIKSALEFLSWQVSSSEMHM